MTRTTLLIPLLAACSLEKEDIPADGTVTVQWQVGASGCELSGVKDIEIDIDGRVETSPCAAGAATVPASPGRHTVDLYGLDADGVARYAGSDSVTVYEGEDSPMSTIVLGALPASVDVTWYFENGRLCGGNGVTDVQIVIFDNDFIVESLETACDDGIERVSDILAGDYTISVLAYDSNGAVAFSGNSDATLDKGDQAFVEVMLIAP
jgi:hypothetical protein